MLAMGMASFYTSAHTVVWQLMPKSYDEIVRINSNLFKVVKNGKIGLINSDGSVVAELENDNLSDFHENYALMTQNDGYGERVRGCLSEDGKYQSFAKRYYTLTGQKFYSNGVISVSDENGKLGYIDCHGNPIIGFDGKYDRIKPFVEGYAAVFKNKKYHLIDKDGIPVKFRFKSVGEVYGGTNVYNGMVYIWDTDGKFHTFDVNKEGICKSAKKPADLKQFDYLYRFSSISGKSKEIPFYTIERPGIKGIQSEESEGIFGYSDNGQIVLPPQLTFASQFEDDLAIVGINGEFGILRFIKGEDFNLFSSASSIKFYGDDSVACDFNLSAPRSWRGKDLNVIISGPEGEIYDVSDNSGTYSFNVKPHQSCDKNFIVKVYAEGLKLYESSLNYSFIKKYKCTICGKDKDVCRGHEEKREKKTEKTKLCPTCGKPISQCRFQGVH